MRFVWGSLLGLLLCGTIVHAGISSEDLEDGVPSSSLEDVLSLLRSEHLMRADDTNKDTKEPKPDKDTKEPEPDKDTKEPEPDKDTKEPEPATCKSDGNEKCEIDFRNCVDKDEGGYTCGECLNNYKEHNGKCVDCDCGDAKCSLDNEGKKVCTCPPKKAYFEKKCNECDCGDTDKCELDDKGKKKTCVCAPKQKIFNQKCKICDCAQKLCDFSSDGSKVCSCPDKMAIFEDKCVDCDCGDTDICNVDKEGNKLECKCYHGQKLLDEKCVRTCKSEGDKKCNTDFRNCVDKDDGGYNCGECLKNYKEHNGKCVDTCASKGNMECVTDLRKCVDKDDGGYTCGECLENYKEDNGRCRRKCNDKESKCRNGGICENDFCTCSKGYDGDFCDPKCTDALNKTCEKIKAVCVYDSEKDEAVCKCKDENFVFKDGACKTAKWCIENPCKFGECLFENKVGQCKCKEAGQFFNYHAEKCEKMNPCLTKKDSCGANQECNPNDGQCKCVSGYEWDEEKKACKDNACNENPCSNLIDGAECKETGIANTVKCVCKKHEFYDGRKCEVGGCFLKEKKCSDCPDGTKHNKEKDVCEIEDKAKSCQSDCGFGWCIKKDDAEKCVCYDTGFVTENENKCVLNQIACASGEVEADGKKCKCTGIYKLSSNGITCERKTCEDDEIKAECDAKNAKCVTKWEGEASHSCECETGYVRNPPPDGKCIRPCEVDNFCDGDLTCYLKNIANEYACKCPPSFKQIENNLCVPDSSGTNVILRGLLVKKAKYLKENEIDLIKLNKDVIDAMNAIYFPKELEFALLYNHKTDGDSIVCDVWLQFYKNNMGNADRWKVVKAQSGILPPALELSDGEWQKKMKAEKMEFCSEEIRTNVCGQHTECEKNKCSCKSKGYREIKSSIRFYPGDFKSMFCEDIDECKERTHECTANTTCINTAGDYFCKCKEGHKKVKGEPNADDKESCTDLCTPNPCKNGACSLKNNAIDCTCSPGAGGSLCDREDENFKRASKNTVVVGAVLGTILGVVVILLAFYIRRQRKNSYSEDFTPPPRMDNSEMVERGRPMRGVNNRGYQN